MHPALSVIFLTVLIGAGQGLFLALFASEFLQSSAVLPEKFGMNFYVIGSLISVGLLALGLFSSFFHLGHPERAWRSAAKWKTSWLSREVIVLPLAMLMMALYGGAHYLQLTDELFTIPNGTVVSSTVLLGAIATIVTFALFICTAMIYGCIKFLQEWHSPLTVVNFSLLGMASGFTLATALSAYMGAEFTQFFASAAIFLTILAAFFRIASMVRNSKIHPKSDLKSAIGVNHPVIKQISQGSMGGSFNTREYFHGKKMSFVKNMKYIFLILAFVVPLILLLISFDKAIFVIPVIAFAIQMLGLLAERWYFFADANHPQNLYYQQIS
ncbi:MAG: DmsC/YnfH family molybdoenzyme membrane anchor subunit [Cocleimonas sp.]